MYLSTSCCTLCKEHISSKVKYNLKTSTAEKSNVPLLKFVEVFNQDIIFSHCNICRSCHNLLNELDVLKQREKEITSRIKSYVKSKKAKRVSLNDTLPEPQPSVKVIEEFEVPNVDLKKLPIKIKRVTSPKKHKITPTNSSESFATKDVDCVDEYFCDSLPRSLPQDEPQDDVSDETKDALLFERIQHLIKEDLSKHEAEKQSKAKPSSALCEICGQNFKSKNGYEKHMKKHNNVDDDLKLLTLNKGEDDDYQCSTCGKEFNQKIAKKRHMAIHTGETRYQCDHCGKKFIHHSSFNMHMKIHAGVRNFKCDMCNRTFLNSSHLKRHVRSLHVREKQHACGICGKKFAERYNLEAHVRALHVEIEGPIVEEIQLTEEVPNDKTEEATVIYQMQEDGTFFGGVALLKNEELVVSATNVLYTF